ncbi:transposase [Nonomuraea sp. NPDC049709]|uniref:transposase n=1 Tax=Nonomuraea sp. NPDC049709 TaxID=3154736 RepID=UPI00343760ED
MSLMVMKNYPPEFKADAVALVLSRPDRTITSIARDLGISRETLRVWVRAAQARGQGKEEAAGRVTASKLAPSVARTLGRRTGTGEQAA